MWRLRSVRFNTAIIAGRNNNSRWPRTAWFERFYSARGLFTTTCRGTWLKCTCDTEVESVEFERTNEHERTTQRRMINKKNWIKKLCCILCLLKQHQTPKPIKRTNTETLRLYFLVFFQFARLERPCELPADVDTSKYCLVEDKEEVSNKWKVFAKVFRWFAVAAKLRSSSVWVFGRAIEFLAFLEWNLLFVHGCLDCGSLDLRWASIEGCTIFVRLASVFARVSDLRG